MAQLITFGTDGIRGAYGKFPINDSTITQMIDGILYWLKQKTQTNFQVVIGRDTRSSSQSILNFVNSSILSSGNTVLDLGITCTPSVSYITEQSYSALGLMITASHNPWMDNGIKFFNHQGTKFSSTDEKEIEKAMNLQLKIETSCELGQTIKSSNDLNFYTDKLKQEYYRRLQKKIIKKKLVLDCSNGALSYLAPKVLTELGYSINTVACSPNGRNINDNCGATYPQLIASETVKHNADIGASFDGDGDRLILSTHKGRIIDGDAILWYLAPHFIGKNKGVVGTQMTNLFVEQSLKQKKVPFERSQVGDKWVLEKLLKNQWELGTEPSGHILMPKLMRGGDALLTLLILLTYLGNDNLDDVMKDYTPYPSELLNIGVNKACLENHDILNRIAEIVRDNPQARILIRASGTEDLVRILVESKDSIFNKELTKTIAQILIETSEYK